MIKIKITVILNRVTVKKLQFKEQMFDRKPRMLYNEKK